MRVFIFICHSPSPLGTTAFIASWAVRKKGLSRKRTFVGYDLINCEFRVLRGDLHSPENALSTALPANCNGS